MKPLLREILNKVTGGDQRAIRWFEGLALATVPEGGAAGQVLSKASGDSFALEWADGGGGGSVAWADVTGKPAFSAVATSGAYGDLSGIPATFTPSAHTHPLSDLQGSGATVGQVPQWDGVAWVPFSMASAVGGNLVADFGPAPGTGYVAQTVVAPSVTPGSRVKAWVQGSTADHNEIEHLLIAGRTGLMAVPGAGAFTVHLETELRLTGEVALKWEAA